MCFAHRESSSRSPEVSDLGFVPDFEHAGAKFVVRGFEHGCVSL